MAIRYSDQEIALLIQERKPLPADWRARLRIKTKLGHREQHLDLVGDARNEFRLILRQNSINPIAFSIILAVQVPESSQLFRLRRCNGKSHQHTNRIEGDTFYDFHIHIATERYQEVGPREDFYAEPTDRYSDFYGALHCMIEDAGLEIPGGSQGELFEEG